MSFEDLVQAQGYELLTPAGGHWRPQGGHAGIVKVAAAGTYHSSLVLHFNEGPGGLPSQSRLCHMGTVKVGHRYVIRNF